MKNIDKYRGCLIGGAAGDALGYAVEFKQDYEIFQRYGEKGITEFALANGVAEISDDTQMTLFTAIGLLVGATKYATQGKSDFDISYIDLAYKDWLKTQYTKPGETSVPEISWLNNIPELNSPRAPGNTCISACKSSDTCTISVPINNSKGCGGVMRVAPIGLYLGHKMPADEVAITGAEVAALTHGHELGYIPAAALAHIVNLLSHSEDITISAAVNDSIDTVKKLFATAKHLDEFLAIMESAISLSKEDMDDLEAIRQLGEGWVAEEALAIAVYCALKYSLDFEKAIIASVNHSGDSDSTGAITGNILGAYLCLSGIPKKFIDNLELKDVITEVADDLYNDCQMSEYGSYHDEKWVQKYIEHNYRG